MFAQQLRVAGSLLAVAVVLAAQAEPAGLAPASPPRMRFDVGPTLATMTPATNGTADPERPVAHAAWVTLALIANGSTLRTGMLRAEVRAQTNWLVGHQQENGFVVGSAPPSRSEQWLGALAITEACEAPPQYRNFLRPSKQGIASAAATMLADGAPPATLEEFVGAILVARTATVAKRDAEAIAQIDLARLAARSCTKAGKVRRAEAILHLDELLQGHEHPPELTIARTWPANPVADPLHTLVGALAVSVSPMTEKQRAAQFETLTALVAARVTEGEHAGTWAPAAGFDRTVTTAMHAITLALANGPTPLLFAKPRS